METSLIYFQGCYDTVTKGVRCGLHSIPMVSHSLACTKDFAKGASFIASLGILGSDIKEGACVYDYSSQSLNHRLAIDDKVSSCFVFF